MLRKLSEEEMEEIRGGEYISGLSIAALLSILTILVTVYKVYSSNKGKAKIGNDYSFEWA